MGGHTARITAADFVTPPEMQDLRLAAHGAGRIGGVRLGLIAGARGTQLGACYQQVPLRVLPLFLGGNLEQERQRHITASPLYWVTPHAAPTLCVHGTKDKYVAHEQAVWLVDRLKAADVEAELFTLEGAGHGFGGKDAERAEKAMLEFFDRHLKSK